ncbi:MAG: UDP-N-acetylmuramate dehydrogenase [Alphaproteobacteria bacterium]|nr:UDP-N-acetylmuramate dehydrogenase [Alphaproteobacteria bacterium]
MPEQGPRFAPGLEARLPKTRGRLTPNAPLGHMTWFGVGGPAEVLFKPADREDLIDFIKNCPDDVPVTVLGVASNMIIRDGGVPGVVIRLGRDFATVEKDDNYIVTAGAAALDMNVALFAAREKIAGLEFLSGIPGTIGGALRMNAGAYGGETKDILISADVLFPDGTVKAMTPDEMQMGYRHNALPKDVIFLSAKLQGRAGVREEIEARMDEIKTKRGESQPIKTKTGGSTFANPEGMSAWKLVDEAGCRGLIVGGAQMSELHCNFMINTGDASAADIERLGETVRKRVAENSGIMLRWEIRRIGVPLEQDEDIRALMQEGDN